MTQQTSVCANCGQPIEPTLISCPGCGLFPRQAPVAVNLPDFFAGRQVSAAALKQSNMPCEETTYLALGGGLGSFAWVDYLRVCGASTDQIAIIGSESIPHAYFRQLCLSSQIADGERIRSDSSARPDNLWGWPGYALHELVALLWRHEWAAAGRIAWQIFGEPTLANTYAPTAQTVYTTLEREMRRIEWWRMVRKGEICAVRQTDDGRYAVVYLPPAVRSGRHPRAIIAPYLHLALGYAGICLTPEAQSYRRTYRDWRRVVQAYENHEHVYEQLGRQGGVVILRGRGIVASRILQRLDEVRRQSGQPIQVIHLLRAPITEDATYYEQARRQAHYHRQVQPFNWPKAAFGGELREVLERATPEERRQLAAIWGGTTTSDRPDWREVVERGNKEGWYSLAFGTIAEIKPNGRDRLIIKTESRETPTENGRLVADFLFDCTGLNTKPANHPILADLAHRYGLSQNASGGWLVSPDFEVKALRNGRGQVFAAGIMTAGNAFAPVDSFLGLQYAAQRSANVLIREGADGLRGLKGMESVRQWWRWVNGAAPTT